MEKSLLKPDTIFEKDDRSLYMWKIDSDRMQETINAVTLAYPVTDYVVKGNFIYVETKRRNLNKDDFDLETAYRCCIHTFNKSQPYFESEISDDNTIINKHMFVVLPSGQDVVDLQPKTTDKFKEHLLDQIEQWMGQKDEKLFDKLFKELYNINQSGDN